MTPRGNLGWRMSDTEAGLQKGSFFVLDIPPPDTFEYKDYSVRMAQSQGGQSRHGHYNVTLLWNGLTPRQSHHIRSIIETGLAASGYIYLTVDRSNGTASGRDWIDVRVRPEMPDFQPQAPVAGAEGIMHGSARLFGNDLFIVNDPASF